MDHALHLLMERGLLPEEQLTEQNLLVENQEGEMVLPLNTHEWTTYGQEQVDSGEWTEDESFVGNEKRASELNSEIAATLEGNEEALEELNVDSAEDYLEMVEEFGDA